MFLVDSISNGSGEQKEVLCDFALPSCDDVLPGFRESRQESIVFRLYEDSKLRREEDEEEGAQFPVIYSLSWCL